MIPDHSIKTLVSRRGFLKGTSLGIGLPVLGGVLAACGATNSQAPAPAATTTHDTRAAGTGRRHNR